MKKTKAKKARKNQKSKRNSAGTRDARYTKHLPDDLRASAKTLEELFGY